MTDPTPLPKRYEANYLVRVGQVMIDLLHQILVELKEFHATIKEQ